MKDKRSQPCQEQRLNVEGFGDELIKGLEFGGERWSLRDQELTEVYSEQ